MSHLHRTLARAACGFAALTFAVACGDGGESAGVSYASDLDPLFQERCVICHYDGRDERTLQHPFDAEIKGMFTQESRWTDALDYNVVPGDPDNSFLMQKITDQELLPASCDAAVNDCPAEHIGLFMPPRPPPATDAQVETVSQWIREGATNTPFFRTSVVPLFGEKDNFRGAYCARGGYAAGCMLCGRCHYEGAPTYPMLESPKLDMADTDDLIAQWLDGLVGASAQYRPDLQLIVPGDPDASFLIMKMKAKSSSTALGAPMPYGYEPLSEVQVETIRSWIAEGAPNN